MQLLHIYNYSPHPMCTWRKPSLSIVSKCILTAWRFMNSF